MAVLLLAGCSRGSVQDALGMGKRSPDEFAVVKRAPLIVPPEYDLRPPEPGAPRPNIGDTSDQARVALTGGQNGPSEAAQILGGAVPPATDQNTLTGRGPAEGLPGSVPAGAVADQALAAGTWTSTDGQIPASQADGRSAAAATAADTRAARPGLTQGEQAMMQLAGGDQADPDIRRTIAEENQALADVEASLFTRIVDWRSPSTMGATVDAPAEAQRLRTNRIEGQPVTQGDTPTVTNRRQSALQGLLEGIF